MTSALRNWFAARGYTAFAEAAALLPAANFAACLLLDPAAADPYEAFGQVVDRWAWVVVIALAFAAGLVGVVRNRPRLRVASSLLWVGVYAAMSQRFFVEFGGWNSGSGTYLVWAVESVLAAAANYRPVGAGANVDARPSAD